MRIVLLTGAGVSAESGLGTFRDLGGIWSQVDLTEVATPDAFARDPARVLDFYDARRAQAQAAAPNAAHWAIADLLEAPEIDALLVTQNVDDLHERAGADPARILHMHGALCEALCAACGAVTAQQGDIGAGAVCAACGGGPMRPNVVWFGEIPHGLDRISAALDRADLFVSIGTSGAVYPAAGFVAEARARGIRTLELNLEPSAGAHLFDESRIGPATEIVPDWVTRLLASLRQ